MSLYAYCLTDEVTTLEVAVGVNGARPRTLKCGEIYVVVSDFEGEQVFVTRESVFAHERVVQSVLRHATPLPFRFGTIVSAERLEGYVTENREALIRNLDGVRGSVEMSVKIIWDREDERREAMKDEKDGAMGMERAGAGAGTAYLAARRREILGDKLLNERAQAIAERLTEMVGESARERQVDVRPAEQLVVRAAFLVQRERLQDYQQRVDETRRINSGLHFLTSGPWPPYSFSNIKP